MTKVSFKCEWQDPKDPEVACDYIGEAEEVFMEVGLQGAVIAFKCPECKNITYLRVEVWGHAPEWREEEIGWEGEADLDDMESETKDPEVRS